MSTLKKSSGFTIVEILVGLGMSMIGVLSIMAVMNVMSKKNAETENLAWAYDLRFEVSNAINNKTAFDTHTVNANPSMACIRNQTSCAGQGGLIQLRDPNNAPVRLVANLPTDGITRWGQACNTFGSDPNCPYRYEISWTPICAASSNCASPQIQVVGKMRVSAVVTANQGQKMATFNLTINKIEKMSAMDVAQICGFLKGTMSAGKCILGPGNPCVDPARPYLLGYNSDGNPLCGFESKNTRCPPGGALTSLNKDGTYTCVDGCSGTGAQGGEKFGFSL